MKIGWLGIIATACLCALASSAEAQVSEQVKPRILLLVDNSGSMDNNVVGNVPESCSGGFTKFDHAKCAIARLVDVNGDIDFALSAFRKNTQSGVCGEACVDDGATCLADGLTNSASDLCLSDGSIDCSPCDPIATNDPDCTAEMRSPQWFQLLVPFVADAADSIATWVDFSCGGATQSCTQDPAENPELTIGAFTPIGASLRGAKRFIEGNDPNYDENSATDLESIYGAAAANPIAGDAFALVDGIQCRPYIVVTLTDGAESCENFSGTQAAAAALLSTTADNGTGPFDYRVETKPIGFGFNPPNPPVDCTGTDLSAPCQIEALANAGGAAGDGLTGANLEGLYAANEDELFAAFNTIIADSIKVEVCNGVDDDCDGNVDEGFNVGAACSDGEIGFCLDEGTIVCDLATGISFCNAVDDEEPEDAPTEVCNNITDDCDIAIDEGLNCVVGCTPDDLACDPGVDCCDGFDNDCDGTTDEDAVIGQECGATDEGVCEFGVTTCIAGQVNCTGEVEGGPELCNGIDDDCDGVPDNDAICPKGTSCVEGGCRSPCDPGEFPCSFGFTCVSDFCVPDPCTNCSAELACIKDQCVDLCEGVGCESNEECVQGVCLDCNVLGCDNGEVCFDSICQVNPCENAGCEEACVDGNCIPTCDSFDCPDGARCNALGECALDACVGVDCKDSEICVEGACLPNPCNTDPCTTGTICAQGECQPDRCLLTQCAEDFVCSHLVDGTPICVPGEPPPPVELVSAAGGGRFCSLGQGRSGVVAMALLLLAMFLGLRRRNQ